MGKKNKSGVWKVEMVEVRSYDCTYHVVASSQKEAEAKALLGVTVLERCKCTGLVGKTLEPHTHPVQLRRSGD